MSNRIHREAILERAACVAFAALSVRYYSYLPSLRCARLGIPSESTLSMNPGDKKECAV